SITNQDQVTRGSQVSILEFTIPAFFMEEFEVDIIGIDGLSANKGNLIFLIAHWGHTNCLSWIPAYLIVSNTWFTDSLTNYPDCSGTIRIQSCQIVSVHGFHLDILLT